MNLKDYLFKKSVIITVSILLLFVIIEFSVDVVEIVIGQFLEATNPIRKKTGTIWELNQKNIRAAENMAQFLPDSNDVDKMPDIDTVLKLKGVLEERETVVLSADQFSKIYSMLPPAAAGQIISPFDLLAFSQHESWAWTKISKTDSRLSIIFLKGDNEMLFDSYPDMSVLYQSSLGNKNVDETLESMPDFSGRIFSADQFFTAFDKLPNAIKLQLINNPYQLFKWHKNIKQVAIARTIQDYTVRIGFEVEDYVSTKVHTFEGSMIAANYLIEQLNSLYPDLKLKTPGF